MRRPESSETVTHGVRVYVEARHVPGQAPTTSHPHLFEYHVTIVNEGDVTFTILGRRWTIIDADGHIESVDGDGVIGQTPVLQPGETFTYDSFCPLKTAWGTMEGAYRAALPDGREFEILIDRFHLFEGAAVEASPNEPH